MVKQKEKRLTRPELYVKILRHYKQKPAAKSPKELAYFTTDHLRAIYYSIEGETKCQSPQTR